MLPPSPPSTPSSFGSYAYRSRSRSPSEASDDGFQAKRICLEGPQAPQSPDSGPAALVSPVSLTSVSQRGGSPAPLASLVPTALFQADGADPWHAVPAGLPPLPALTLPPPALPMDVASDESDDASSIVAAPAAAPATGPQAAAPAGAPGISDHEHEEAVDVYVDGQRVITRACFVARDAELGAHMNHTLTCAPAEGFSGLYATDIGSDLVLIVLPPEGMQGLVYMRQTTARGDDLALLALHLTQAYTEETELQGRFVVGYATSPLWEDLDNHRIQRQGAGETLDEVVDALILDHDLQLPLSQPALNVPGSAPPTPAGERFRQAGELMALNHAGHAAALAETFHGEAVELTHAAVFASWDGNVLDFIGEPEHEFVDVQADESDGDDEGDGDDSLPPVASPPARYLG